MSKDKALTPASFVKSAGLGDLKELAEITEQSEQTLINWFNNPKKRALFECAVKGALVIKWELSKNDKAYWLAGVKRIQERYSGNQDTYKAKMLKFAHHCIELYPNGIGAVDCVGIGSPRYLIEELQR